MNKIFIVVLLSISLLLIVSSYVIINPMQVEAEDIHLENPIKATTTEALINNIINFIWEIALVATPLMVVIGAIIMTTSVGNPEQIKTGKNTIIWALAGFALILLSKGLFELIRKIIGVKGG